MVKILRAIWLAAAGLWLCAVCGCGPWRSGDDLYVALQDEDPAVRIEAGHRAGQVKDQAAVPYLVDRLTDSEKDVRFFAIIALQRITGETMGWRYYEPVAKRAEAVRRWREWLRRRGKRPTTARQTKDRT